MASTVNDSDSSFAQLQRILKAQKAATENAFRRKGEQPKDLQPRSQCINEHTMAYLSSKMHGMETRHMINSTVIGNPYPPSVASFQDLNKLMIKDLKLETNHRGFYLLLRFVCPAFRMSAINNVAEDEAGTVVAFSLYMQEPETVRRAESILKERDIIILKEPYFKVGINGKYLVRVDQPTDIIWLSVDDPRVPMKWRASSASILNSAEHWKTKGNDLVGKAKFFEAIEMYSRALRSSPTQEEEETLRRNRALAYLRIEAFDGALNDTSSLSDPQEKGLYRKALALYGLGRFKDAIEVLQILVRTYPDSAPGKHELERCRARAAEQESGMYDFKALYKETKLRPPRLDHASYKGPVEVRESIGQGRGLFVTRSVKAGELLICEKAFSYCFAASSEELAKTSSRSLSQTSYLMDIPRNSITLGTKADLISDISNKLALNPSLKSTFEDLFCGDYRGITATSVDENPVVDTFLVARIIQLNCFGCPLTSKHMIDDPKSFEDDLHTTGIWILASYINHSCDSTCSRAFIGDLQIIRAARDMPANTELTFSYVTRGNSADLNKKLTSWGFQCDCAMCSDDRETAPAVKVQRRKLVKEFNAPSTSTKRKESIINLLDKTYRSPSLEVPRFQMWNLHLSLAKDSAKRADTDKLIEQVLAAFESLGFIVEGARLPSSPNPKIIVRKWGFPHYGATQAWLTLRNMYKWLGQDELADQAKEFARITYTLLVGEDTTFVYE